MRVIGSLLFVSLSLLVGSARAEPRRAPRACARSSASDARIAYVDDEPISQRVLSQAAPSNGTRADDVGQRREIVIAAPSAVTVDSGAAASREHEVAPMAAVTTTNDDGSAEILAELAARQLARETRRHQTAIDGCIAAAAQRHPAAVGTLTIALEIADHKLAALRVSDDSVHDAALANCLVTIARSFHFSPGAARLVWPITLTPSVSR